MNESNEQIVIVNGTERTDFRKIIFLLIPNAHAFEKAPSRCYYHRCCEKKTTPVWEFRNANAITKFIGVFIAADLRPLSVVDKQAVFF